MIYGKIADAKTRKIYPGKITVKDGVITSIEPIAENDPQALAKGMPLWETIEAATATPVQHYGLKSGLLQVGDPADFIVVDKFEEFNVPFEGTAFSFTSLWE